MTAKQTPRRDTGGQQTSAGSGTSGNTLPDHDAAGELAAWGAAVTHLHRAGLPAAVPEFAARWLARRGVRGVRADWVSTA
jgi:hypothetical protein